MTVKDLKYINVSALWQQYGVIFPKVYEKECHACPFQVPKQTSKPLFMEDKMKKKGRNS